MSKTPVFAYVPSAYKDEKVYAQVPDTLTTLDVVRSSEAYRMTQEGQYLQTGNNEIRQHYPLSAEGDLLPCPVLFCEQQATNENTYSIDYGSWTLTNLVITANDFNAPSLVEEADILEASAVNGEHKMTINNGPTGGGNTIVSCWAHPGLKETIKLEITKNGVDHYSFFNIRTGGFGDKLNIDSQGSQKYPNGWVRVWIKADTDAGMNNFFPAIYVTDGLTAGSETWQGSGNESVYIWGVQTEFSAIVKPSSFIKTNAVPLTRANETIETASLGNLVNSTAGVFYVDVSFSQDSDSDASISLSDGTASNRVFMARDAGTGDIHTTFTSGGVAQSTETISTSAKRTKIAISFQKNLCYHYLNGVEYREDLVVTPVNPFVLNEVGLHQGSALNRMDGYVHEIRVYNPTHYSSSELQSFLKELTSD